MSLPPEVQGLLDASKAGLATAMSSGHPVAAEDLAGHAYLGISLGLPAWVDRALWKTFVKAFAPAESGSQRGWNVKLAQQGLDGPHTPLKRADGGPQAFGHFAVMACPDGRVAGLNESHVLLDYAVSNNAMLDPTRAIRDPLVSLRADGTDVLLGRTYAAVMGSWLGTPSYFALVRAPALQHLADPEVVWPVG